MTEEKHKKSQQELFDGEDDFEEDVEESSEPSNESLDGQGLEGLPSQDMKQYTFINYLTSMLKQNPYYNKPMKVLHAIGVLLPIIVAVTAILLNLTILLYLMTIIGAVSLSIIVTLVIATVVFLSD